MRTETSGAYVPVTMIKKSRFTMVEGTSDLARNHYRLHEIFSNARTGLNEALELLTVWQIQ